MRKMGLEPTRHECHKILSLARLPVPTLPHFCIYRPLFFFQTTDRKINITIILHECQSFFLIFRFPLYTLHISKTGGGSFCPAASFPASHLYYFPAPSYHETFSRRDYIYSIFPGNLGIPSNPTFRSSSVGM